MLTLISPDGSRGRGRIGLRTSDPRNADRVRSFIHRAVDNLVDKCVDRDRRVWSSLIAGVVVSLSLLGTAAPLARARAMGYDIRIDTAHPVLRLYQSGKLLRTYPVALGKVQTETPIGSWRIVDKQRDWGRGFGTRWLGLNVPWGTYGIHGTNRPTSIGQYASSGCIRMHNADVEALYEMVPIGTPVEVLGNPLRRLRKLEFGHIGADVRLVQQALARKGFYHGACAGRFDSATLAAVLHFQLALKLTVDGMVTVGDYRALGLIQ